MSINAKPSELVAVLGTIDPDAQAAGAVTSDYVSLGDFNGVMAVVQTGILGTSATVDAVLVQATDSAGTGSKAITGKAITQLVKATNDDDQAILQVVSEELDTDNGFTHVACTLTVGTATSDVGCTLLGVNPRHAPASDNDIASVVEIV